MRVAVMQGLDGLMADSPDWKQIKRRVQEVRPDILVTNEMPFGNWLAGAETFDPDAAAASVAAHEGGLLALQGLGVPVVLSSRPVMLADGLANEAFTLAGGTYCFGHHKHYFPAEPGFHETMWFRTGRSGFDAVEAAGIRAGFLLCTELFFNEWARQYRRQGAQLIAVPRASGESVDKWHAAARMAAIVSGCFVASSNRAGWAAPDLTFGGRGFAMAPDGTLMGETSESSPVFAFDLDPERSASQQAEYPCYVTEAAIRPTA